MCNKHGSCKPKRSKWLIMSRSTVDPLVQLCSFGKKKNTSAKNDIGSAGAVYWGEHLFIESGFVVRYNPH